MTSVSIDETNNIIEMGNAVDLMTKDEAIECVKSVNQIAETIVEGITNLRQLVFELRERKGWKVMGYDSWETFVKKEIKISPTHARRLKDFGEIESGMVTRLINKVTGGEDPENNTSAQQDSGDVEVEGSSDSGNEMPSVETQVRLALSGADNHIYEKYKLLDAEDQEGVDDTLAKEVELGQLSTDLVVKTVLAAHDRKAQKEVENELQNWSPALFDAVQEKKLTSKVATSIMRRAQRSYYTDVLTMVKTYGVNSLAMIDELERLASNNIKGDTFQMLLRTGVLQVPSDNPEEDGVCLIDLEMDQLTNYLRTARQEHVAAGKAKREEEHHNSRQNAGGTTNSSSNSYGGGYGAQHQEGGDGSYISIASVDAKTAVKFLEDMIELGEYVPFAIVYAAGNPTVQIENGNSTKVSQLEGAKIPNNLEYAVDLMNEFNNDKGEG